MNKNDTLVKFDDKHALTERDFMQGIDNELIALYDTGDFNRATKLVQALDSLDTVSGHAKARFLYGFDEWWKENKPEENFPDHIESTTSTRGITVKRYVLTQRYIEQSVIPKALINRPMRELIPIAKTLAQGFEISKEQWRKIELCSNDRELGDILRKIKGQEPRKNARVIRLDRNGTLWLYKDGQKKSLGYLDVLAAKTDTDIAEAIEKIMVSAGVIEE